MSNKTGLPARYETYWGHDFWAFVHWALVDGSSVLDVGAGRQPTIAPADRPPGIHYVGMDIEASELELAAPGSYDETVAGDAEVVLPELVNRFDLALSWQVLEHVRHLDRAAAAFDEYLRPGGWYVAMLSGRNAIYALANRALSPAVGARLVAHLKQRPLETVFRAYYDQCTDTGLRRVFSRFDELHVIPYWRAGNYFERVRPLQHLYLRYENWAADNERRDLATHYVVAARKSVSGSAAVRAGSAARRSPLEVRRK